MKLMGTHNNRKKDGSNSNSSRTSPSRLEEDTEFVKNSLLDSNDDQELCLELTAPSDAMIETAPVDQIRSQLTEAMPKENGNVGRSKKQQLSKGEAANSSAVHPLRSIEDDNLDYDSNASSSSFEFHKERSARNQLTRSFSRPVSSKWNDAEKWIMNRQNMHTNCSKKNALNSQANQMNIVRVAPESAKHDLKSSFGRAVDTGSVDFGQPALQMALDKFSFIPPGTPSISAQYAGHALISHCNRSKDWKEVDQRELAITRSSVEDTTVLPVLRSVCMRDMGTEMTPVTSQEPSRTATPVGAATPHDLGSPTSSIPSTPRRDLPVEHGTDDDKQSNCENGKKELTEQELKLKTRREIVALGMKLGKMSIAAWASKEDLDKKTSSVEETTNWEELERFEFNKRAAAWEEAEKSKHAARYKREEIRIQAWESQQKAKLDAEIRKIEARVEQMQAKSQAKMVKKIALAAQKSEEMRAAAEARKNRDAERTAAQAEHVRRTGQTPSSNYICCCRLF